MKWSLYDAEKDNFFDFMKKFVVQNPKYIDIISQCLDFHREDIEDVIMPLCDLIDDDIHKLTRTRAEFVIKLIMTRKRILEKTLGL